MTAMIGRAAQVQLLTDALDAAIAGAGSLTLITGEPGVGKSRLVEELVLTATGRGIQVVAGYAVADPGAPPLWPWLRVARRLPELERTLTDPVRPADLGSRFALFDTFAEKVRQLAEPSGLLVVLEDLHWADRTSLLLLQHLASELADSRMLVVATARDDSPGPGTDLLPEIVARNGSRRIRLDGLTPPELSEWVRQYAGRTLEPASAARLAEVVGGNPLFLRLLVESSWWDAGAGSAPSFASQDLFHAVPELSTLVLTRVRNLPRPARELVDLAAVLAERIHPAVLAEALDVSPEVVEQRVAAAVAGGVLVQDPTTATVLFRHALVRDAIHSSLSGSQRQHLHRRIAEVLGTLHHPGIAGVVAGHWQQAGGPVAEVLAWYRRATADATTRHARDEAVRYATAAVAAGRSGGVDDADLADLLIDLAGALVDDGQIQPALAVVSEVGAVGRRCGRGDLVAQGALVMQGVGSTDVYRILRPLCDHALAAGVDPVLRARLLAQVATAVAEEEGGPQAADLAAQAIKAAEASGDDRALLEAVAARHLTITIPQRVTERRHLADRAAALADRVGSPIATLWAMLWRLDAAFQLGDMRDVDRQLALIDEVATNRRSTIARWHHHRFLATRAALTGDVVGATGHARDARELSAKMGDASSAGMFQAFMIQLDVIRKVPVADLDQVRRILEWAPRMPLVDIVLPTALALLGRLDEARAEFNAFREIPRTYPVGTRWAPTVSQIAQVAVLLDDRQVAEDAYQVLLPIAGYYGGDGSGVVFSGGSNATLLGDLAVTAGRYDEALRLYADAVAMNSRIGARPGAALARLGWAQALLRRGPLGTAERAQAVKFAETAAAEFRRLDMPGRLVDADSLLSALRQGSVGPLSAREIEVADLVAEPLTNAGIAARLHLSERTVESHVRNILTKLDLQNRTEIVAWRLRQE